MCVSYKHICVCINLHGCKLDFSSTIIFSNILQEHGMFFFGSTRVLGVAWFTFKSNIEEAYMAS